MQLSLIHIYTDLIGQCALHLAAGTAAPEVTAANHDADLHTQLVRFLHAAADRVHGGFIKTHALFAAQCFAADLQKDTPVSYTHLDVYKRQAPDAC